MKNNEIDAFEELEKARDELSDKIVKRKATSGAGRFFGALIIILTVLGGVGFFLFKNYFQHREVENNTQIFPTASKEIKRTFSIDTEKKEPPKVESDEQTTPAPQTVVVQTSPNPNPQQEVDENGLTPEQAAAQRRLKSGFGAGNDEGSSEANANANSETGSGLSDKSGDGADNGLENSLNTVPTVTVKAFARKSLDLMITRGNSIPCSLTRAIDSTQPGQITCVTIAPTLSSSGKVVLMESGTLFTGNYQSDLKQGIARIQATFDRLETPNKVFMSLRAPAIGAMGQGGIDGEIDTQFGKRFYNTILLATIQSTVAAGSSRLAGGSNGSVNLNSSTQPVSDLATETLKNSINIPPILRKNPGEIINIDVLQDMDFSSVYRIENVN
ncbi:TrbI/VirB10 family protein [Enterobacter hormaechei]|uniref:TrbI/VirB10 family protein n=1 Tax=Enterobacter cloacae complex TaxID=354276 RepID=UPI00069A3175|nr:MULTISPECIES: TrbI/VirB10 family protein [Enterobacter cloacae complex]EKS6399052.1 TrbI/VirB10 family protein [Enterobacter hormaechei]MBJ6593710.1 TrbI/VirB10 family protein [Enterobacter hormaechei]HCD7499024.1 TrbI/VirB10 family protein [Enterobacter hormaechei]